MTLHARLTDLLQGHVLARVDRHAWWCSCRADCTTVEGSFAGHLASVLLSAAGVAVVELPREDDPGIYDFGETCRSAWLIGENDDGDTLDVAVYGESVEVSIPMDENRFDPECARELAAAILAAANTAEDK